MPPPVRILSIPGSLRSRSTNLAALRTARSLAPAGIDVIVYDGLGLLPPFNPDDDRPPLPAPAADLRDRIRDADALLFSTPEYAGALPGSFKNLLDWTIGDERPRSIYRKPVAWLNVSAHGALAAHASLRAVLGYAGAAVVADACVEAAVSHPMVGDVGLIADDHVRAQITTALDSLIRVARAAS